MAQGLVMARREQVRPVNLDASVPMAFCFHPFGMARVAADEMVLADFRPKASGGRGQREEPYYPEDEATASGFLRAERLGLTAVRPVGWVAPGAPADSVYLRAGLAAGRIGIRFGRTGVATVDFEGPAIGCPPGGPAVS